MAKPKISARDQSHWLLGEVGGSFLLSVKSKKSKEEAWSRWRVEQKTSEVSPNFWGTFHSWRSVPPPHLPHVYRILSDLRKDVISCLGVWNNWFTLVVRLKKDHIVPYFHKVVQDQRNGGDADSAMTQCTSITSDCFCTLWGEIFPSLELPMNLDCSRIYSLKKWGQKNGS